MRIVEKILGLMRLGVTSPQEFVDRWAMFLEVRFERLFTKKPAYGSLDFPEAIRQMGEKWPEVCSFLEEASCGEIEQEVQSRLDRLREDGPFPLFHNADFTLARVCYAICRLLRPELVLETGVAYGVTSAFILKALTVNGKGELHSIDLPPLGRDADRFVGILVPEESRTRWHLHRGVSKRVLPNLLMRLRKVDVFIHDSLHTYKNVRFELNTVSPYITRPGVVIVDDVESHSAFLEWTQQFYPDFWVIVRESLKNSWFGIGFLAP